jgi:hypothetical protein
MLTCILQTFWGVLLVQNFLARVAQARSRGEPVRTGVGKGTDRHLQYVVFYFYVHVY